MQRARRTVPFRFSGVHLLSLRIAPEIDTKNAHRQWVLFGRGSLPVTRTRLIGWGFPVTAVQSPRQRLGGIGQGHALEME
jgi:hypothetical protein